jgi:hypothetical protein
MLKLPEEEEEYCKDRGQEMHPCRPILRTDHLDDAPKPDGASTILLEGLATPGE